MSQHDDHGFQPPCPICQGMTFSWGKLGGQGTMQFIEEDAGALEKFLGMGGPLEARVCEGCGNVQLFRKRVQP